MDLPADIEIQIVDYLNLEFGAYKENKKLESGD
jgi:hypothetical protein